MPMEDKTKKPIYRGPQHKNGPYSDDSMDYNMRQVLASRDARNSEEVQEDYSISRKNVPMKARGGS